MVVVAHELHMIFETSKNNASTRFVILYFDITPAQMMSVAHELHMTFEASKNSTTKKNAHIHSRTTLQVFYEKKTEISNLHEFELYRPSSKGTKLLFQVIKANINQCTRHHFHIFRQSREYMLCM